MALVVGVGNRFRGDDGVGPEIALRVRRLGLAGVDVTVEDDPLNLVECFATDDNVVVVDALRPGEQPGRLHVSVVGPALPRLQAVSSHGLGVVEAVELSRALDRLPRRLTLVGVEGATFRTGAPLSAPVRRCLDDAVKAVVEAARS